MFKKIFLVVYYYFPYQYNLREVKKPPKLGGFRYSMVPATRIELVTF